MENNKTILEFLNKNETVNLGNLFEYLQGIAEGLYNVVRWEARDKIAGQSVRENNLQHIFKTTFLTIMCATMENDWRRRWGLLPFGKVQLDIGMLATMALVHDIGEIIEGDIPHFEKEKGSWGQYQNGELSAFTHIVSPLPKEAREYLIQAFKRTMFKSDLGIKDKEATFFNAVENLGFLKRGLHECRKGNLHFAPKCLDVHLKVLEDRSWVEFPSLKIWFKPYINELEELRKRWDEDISEFVTEIEDHLKKFKERRKDYVAEFVSRGGKEEDFPF